MTRRHATTEASASDLRTRPFGHVLLELFDARSTGTLLVYAADDALDAAIRIEAGRPTAVLTAEQGERRVSDILMPLCARIEGRFDFLAGQDLVGDDGLVAAGAIDPLPMVVAAARAELRADLVAQVMRLVSRSLIRLAAGVDLKRYGFTVEERLVLRGLEGAVELEELRARVAVPDDVVQRVLYVLRMTRGITLSPLTRTVSGTEFQAAPLASASSAPSVRPPRASANPPSRHSSAPVQPQRPSTPASRQSSAPVQPQRPSTPASPRSSLTPSPFGELELEPAAARRTSSSPSSSGPTPKESADALWQQAEKLSQREQHDAALRAAHSAIRLGTPSPEREAFLGWLIYQHDGAGPTANPHVWKCLNHALKRDPLCEDVLYYKGLVLGRTGDPENAYAHFQRALMLDPNHEGAQREVRIYDMRREHERQQSGFLRRLLSTRPGAKTE
jgi:hypothetical protein